MGCSIHSFDSFYKLGTDFLALSAQWRYFIPGARFQNGRFPAETGGGDETDTGGRVLRRRKERALPGARGKARAAGGASRPAVLAAGVDRTVPRSVRCASRGGASARQMGHGRQFQPDVRTAAGVRRCGNFSALLPVLLPERGVPALDQVFRPEPSRSRGRVSGEDRSAVPAVRLELQPRHPAEDGGAAGREAGSCRLIELRSRREARQFLEKL